MDSPFLRLHDEERLHHPSHTAVSLVIGLLVVLVSWDHVFFQFQASGGDVGQYREEMWEGPYADYGNQISPFLTRSLSHFVAPGFYLLMGVTMVIFSKSRRTFLGWTWFHIIIHHWLRGLLFVLTDFAFDWPGVLPKVVDLLRGRDVEFQGRRYDDGDIGKLLSDSLHTQFNMLTGLGLAMIASSVLLPCFVSLVSFNRRAISLNVGVFLLVACFSATTIRILLAQDGLDDFDKPPAEFPHVFFVAKAWKDCTERFAFFPGLVFEKWQFVFYPLFPWVGITLLGMGVAPLMMDVNAMNHASFSFHLISFLFLVCFFVIRGLGGELNFRGFQREQDDVSLTAMTFFTQTKYPPDFAFACITLSVHFLVLSFLTRQNVLMVETVVEGGDELDTAEEAYDEEMIDMKRMARLVGDKVNTIFVPLVTFGQSPLFFYVMSRWIIKIIAAIGRIPSEPLRDLSFALLVVTWIIILVLMFVLCRKFQTLVNGSPQSFLWRF